MCSHQVFNTRNCQLHRYFLSVYGDTLNRSIMKRSVLKFCKCTLLKWQLKMHSEWMANSTIDRLGTLNNTLRKHMYRVPKITMIMRNFAHNTKGASTLQAEIWAYSASAILSGVTLCDFHDFLFSNEILRIVISPLEMWCKKPWLLGWWERLLESFDDGKVVTC